MGLIQDFGHSSQIDQHALPLSHRFVHAAAFMPTMARRQTCSNCSARAAQV